MESGRSRRVRFGLSRAVTAAPSSRHGLQRDIAAWAHFWRAPLDQRVTPPAQSRNMDVNPIFPPVNRGRIIAEGLALLFGERRGQQLDIFRLEHLLVLENKRLVKLDQFFETLQVAFLAGQGWALHLKG